MKTMTTTSYADTPWRNNTAIRRFTIIEEPRYFLRWRGNRTWFCERMLYHVTEHCSYPDLIRRRGRGTNRRCHKQ